MPATEEELRELIANPRENSNSYIEFAKVLKAGGIIKWGIPSVDRAIFPPPPGFVVGILGRPGNGKSSVLAYLAKYNAEQLVKMGATNKCVLYITLDQSREEIEAFLQSDATLNVSDLAWGNVDMDKLVAKSMNRVNLPIWVMGRSIIGRKKKRARMTVDNMFSAIRLMESRYGVTPALICIDYIQIVPVEKARERQEQVTQAITDSKELAEDVGAVVMLASQAGRQVVGRSDDDIPGEADSMWTSAFEQTVDKGFSVWRPWTKRGLEEVVDKVTKKPYHVTPNLFILQNWKNRFGEPGERFYLYFDPACVKFADMETSVREEKLVGDYYE